MGDAVHQVLVQGVAKAVLCGTAPVLLQQVLVRFAHGGMEHRNFAVQNALQQLLRLMDAIIHMGEQHRLADGRSQHTAALGGGNSTFGHE